MGTLPSTASLGADPGELERLAAAHERLAAWATSVAPQIRGVGAAWTGPDADRFRATLDSRRRSIAEMSRLAQRAAADLRRNAAEQRVASTDSPVAGGLHRLFDWTHLAHAGGPASSTDPAWITDRSRWMIQADVAGAVLGGELELTAESTTRSDGTASLHLDSSVDAVLGLAAAKMATVAGGATVQGGLTVDFASSDELDGFLSDLPNALVPDPVAIGKSTVGALIEDPGGSLVDILQSGGLGGPNAPVQALIDAQAASIAENLQRHGATISSVTAGLGADVIGAAGSPVSTSGGGANAQGEASATLEWDAVSGEWSLNGNDSIEALVEGFGLGGSLDVTSSLRIPAGDGIVPNLLMVDGNVELQLELAAGGSDESRSGLVSALNRLGVGPDFAAALDPADWSASNLVVDIAVPAASIRQVLSGAVGSIEDVQAMLPSLGVDVRLEQVAETRFDVAAPAASLSVRHQEMTTVRHFAHEPRSPEPS